MGHWSSGDDGELSTLRHGFDSRMPRQSCKTRQQWREQYGNGAVVQLVRMLACHARGRGFEPRPLRHIEKRDTSVAHDNSRALSPSSRGLGHHPFTVTTRVRIPLGTPHKQDATLRWRMTKQRFTVPIV